MEQETIGICAGILTAASLIPPFVKTLREKHVEANLYMLLLLTAGNGLWVWYGIGLESLPIIVTNAFAFTMDITMLVLKAIYPSKK